MNPQSAQAPSKSTDFTSHLHFGLETCPTCGQEIPPDKIEEIAGRIAARDREQTRAITAQLEKQYAVDKSTVEAKAKADLETERKQSALREQQVRDEAHQAAEKLLVERQAQAEAARRELVAEWEQKLAEAEVARQAARQTEASLQAEVRELREQSLETIAAVKAEAERAAEAVAAERIAAIEVAHRESEAGLQARIEEAEASRSAARQNQAMLAAQLDELRRTKDTEVQNVKQEAAAELLLVRQVASQEAEAQFRESLRVREAAAAEAIAKAREAESKVLELTEQHASELGANLQAQREVLERAKEDALNAEKARAFEENQKLSSKVTDLQRALDNKTAEELGEGAELNLFEALKKEFPEDDIRRVPRGAQGADIIHVVMLSGKKCGTIIYDSKDHNQFRNEHVSKLRADQLAADAEHAILSTRKFPQGTRQLHLQDGVLLANPARVVLIATMIRQHLLQLYTQRVSDIERDSKTAALYDFIISERCLSLLARVDERAEDLLEQQNKEIRWHEINWKKQGEAIRAIQKAKAELQNQVHLIIGTSATDAAA
jgi:hypothetical protein